MSDATEIGDEVLAARVRDGDEAAFRVLTDRYSARLMARIRQRLAPPLRRKVAVSDVLQEAYLAAFRGIEAFEDRGEGSFRRWLGQIVEHKLRDVLRRHVGAEKRGVGREVSRRDRRPTRDLPGAGPTPSQVAVGRELREAARAALDKLPPSHREVLALLREQGLTLEEAARRMDRSKDAIKQLYCRALAGLERLLDLGPADGRRGPTR